MAAKTDLCIVKQKNHRKWLFFVAEEPLTVATFF